jgi:predicted TIM-barrel fold metal-dependent hydrolase
LPLAILPLWDPELAAREAARCAELGAVTVAFPENTTAVEIPSLYGDEWESLWRVCAGTGTVISTHIGSGGMYSTSLDAPPLVSSSLTHVKTAGALCDWLLSGIFERHPGLKLSLAEGQVGWMPYQLERLDKVWLHNRAWGDVTLKNPPSSYVAGHVYGCVFDDDHGLVNRDVIGMGQIMFETDYPHSDSTWPACQDVARRITESAGLSPKETWQLLRGNAIECFGLERLGVSI